MRLSRIESLKGRYLFLSKILNLKLGEGVVVKAEVRCNGDVIYMGRNKARSDNGNGYKSVCITKTVEGVRHSKRFYVHRLVATAFLKNPDNLPEVNHKNHKRDDNRLQNLEWISARDNKLHIYKDHVPLCVVDYWRVLNLHYVYKRCMTAISRETSVKIDMVREVLNGKYNDRPSYACLGESGKGIGIIYGRNRLKATGLEYNGGIKRRER